MTSFKALPGCVDGVWFTLHEDAPDEGRPRALSVDTGRRARLQAHCSAITTFACSDRFDPREWDALRIDDVSAGAAWALGAGRGGTPMAARRSEPVERWLATQRATCR